MWDAILSALWFFAPAGLANMAPILAAHLPFLNRWDTPVDLGKTYKGKPIFGQNKTYRGLVAGIVVAYGFLYWQRYAVENGMWASDTTWLDYANLNVFMAALAFALGALLGDIFESFIKRQLGKKPGSTWFPFDQTDYIIGGLIATSFFADIGLENIIVTFAVWFVLHPVATVCGWALGLKEKPI